MATRRALSLVSARLGGFSLSRVPQAAFVASPFRGVSWSPEKEPGHVFKPAGEIIQPELIRKLLENTKAAAQDPLQVRKILAKAEDHALLKHLPEESDSGAPEDEYVQGLNLEETATLLNVDSTNEALMQDLFNTALRIKQRIYGNRIVLFAPLYLANQCVNSCTYCGFRSANKAITRARLSDEQIVKEVEALQRQGHRRLLLLCGESPRFSFDDFLKALELVGSVRTEPHGRIRRINVEIPPLSVSDMRRLLATDLVGTYTVFQETYDPEAYAVFHPDGPKSSYEYRLQTMDRAMAAGIGDVGIGALFGLTDYRFEVLGLLQHAQHLSETWGAGPHTISFPRIRPALNTPDSENVPCPVSDVDFRKIVAITRVAVPYTGMILSTRETKEMRNELVNLGISQMSAGSLTEVGAYSKHDHGPKDEPEAGHNGKEKAGQFSLLDSRPMDRVVADLVKEGFTPSWCTACYRSGRVGRKFMKIAKAGDIADYCQPNALLTFKEYLEDYATEETRQAGEKLVEQGRKEVKKDAFRRKMDDRLERIAAGERDLYF